MAVRELHPVLKLTLILTFTQFICAEVLTPPYFNLAQGREITATSTCGESPSGGESRERYCRLTGATGRERSRVDTEIIQGQFCDYCDRNEPGREHPAKYAIDGTERWWQSPPLSRGMAYSAVNLTVNLGQEFHVAYVFIKMANSPRPGVWALERSVDNGQTWKPWQYFADTPSDCNKFFSVEADTNLDADDSVICATQFSKIVPLDNGEIVVSLVNNRPNAMNFSYAETLQDWTKATNVRLRLLRTKTLLGHLMAVARQDPTTTRRYYYSIKDISIGGRCVCNGHAESCVRSDPLNLNKLVCQCEHNTCGDQCDRCCPNAIQKKWMPGRTDKVFQCETCQCYRHSDECVYDEEVDKLGQSIDVQGNYIGGGVCQNCRHNTMGVNCHQCVPGYYNPYGVPLDSPEACTPCVCEGAKYTGECEAGTGRCLCSMEYTGLDCDSCSFGYYGYPDCIPCDCHLNGTEGTVCTVGGGQCPCKEAYVGSRCDMCAFGFYNFPNCKSCQCDSTGSSSNVCDVETGQCPCQPNYSGLECNQCANGYYNYPECRECDCVVAGTEEGICDKDTGDCLCKTNYKYPRCDRCAQEYYGFPLCQECQCADPGSYSRVCREDGQCACSTNFAGKQCSRCAAGFYRYPECMTCECDLYGAIGQSCDQLTGQCECAPTFEGLMCNRCKEGFYNYPNCEECNCNPAGAKEIPGYPLGGCGVVTRGLLCECKEKVMGRICDQCQPGYYNLNRNNPQGCQELPFRGSCECHAPGTMSGLSNCDPIDGQCMCKTNAGGRRCDRCQDGFYGLSDENTFGCVECNCDMGGSASAVCDSRTGQCRCKPRVRGKRCESPDTLHFFPSLQQLIYEIEDGKTPEGSHIRYGFDQEIFHNFSWRGYAILTHLQPEVLMDVIVTRPSLYRIIYRFENLNAYTVKGVVTVTPQSVADDKQTSDVLFVHSEMPQFVTVGTTSGVKDFVLNPGRWTISIKSPDLLLLDYMVLVPQAYYEATVLQQPVTRPCTIPDDDGPCLYYNYPDLSHFPAVSGENGYTIDSDGNVVPTQVFSDRDILNELDLDGLAKLDRNQNSLNMNLAVPDPGQYIIVVNYFALSNTTQDLNVTIRTAEGDYLGTVSLSNCKYSVLCREVLKDLSSMPALTFINGTAQIILTGDDNIDVAIGSVVAIPYPDWTLGYIRPSIICIRINGICIGSHWSVPADSRRIEFEDPPNHELRVGPNEFPSWIVDGNVGLVHLNDTVSTIEVEATVPNPDRYVFVVHFYLPSEAGIDLPVKIHADGQVYEGMFRPRYCPGVSGCRGLIYFDEEDVSGMIGVSDNRVFIRFNNTGGHDIYLDYLLMIPASRFSAADLDIQPVDNSANFLTNCVGPGFQLISNSEFCRKGIFSLTTEFNNGAVPCTCDIDGSLSFSCVNFGGQCQCRDHVIGRSCTHCTEGYYGFPNCKECNCPYGRCHPITGECVCPPRVAGTMCDQCVAETFGYDPLVGCTDCDCSYYGVLNDDLNCEQGTGQCSCKENIEGRKCDTCHIGFYAFPHCQECNCNTIGTQQTICDQTNGQCLCKANVDAGRCDRCQPGKFNLDPRNPKGCTSCFCFGTTQTCDSSVYTWGMHKDMAGWTATNVEPSAVREAGDIVAILNVQTFITDSDSVIYWVAPQSYLGNKVVSYGGGLKYSFIYMLEDPTTEEEAEGPAVVLTGRNMTIVHKLDAADYQGNRVYEVTVPMVETHFVYSDTSRFVNRDNFMSILVDLQSMHIRSAFTTNVDQLRLMNVTMLVAAADGDDGPALSVEQCNCPPGYTGTSCESCSQGYYRTPNAPFLGACVPCMCNRHTDTCDPDTGMCLGCLDNTMGDHCETCLPGHYGDPSRESCTICSCPLPVASNNFAFGCNVYNGQMVSCDCQPGYAGLLCDRCSPGYYGNPNEQGGRCEMCQCSGNIDMSNRGSCSEVTGSCLVCGNNSTGADCSQCREWWYGDAVNAKNCQACTCDQCGTQQCDNGVGQCQCKPNVQGIDCDSCAPNTYGFDDCEGCRDCNCGLAASSLQCDLVSGQCSCQPGVTGLMCDECMDGYFDYTAAGCQKCDCESDGAMTCNPFTGVCQCLKGVTGDRCDRCLPRWILVPNEGCRPCDNCVHILLDDLEFMDRNLTSLTGNLATVSVGVTALKRLEAINESIALNAPKIGMMKEADDAFSLTPLRQAVTEIIQKADETSAKSQTEIRSAALVKEESEQFLTNALDLEQEVDDSSNSANAAMQDVEDVLATILRGIQVTNIDTYIEQSTNLLDDIMAVNMTGIKDKADSAVMDIFKLDLDRFRNAHIAGEKEAERLANAVNDLADSLYSLQEHGQQSLTNSSDTMTLVAKIRQLSLSIIDLRLQGVEESSRDTEMILRMSQREVAEALQALETCKADSQTVSDQSNSLEDGINQLNVIDQDLSDNLSDLDVKLLDVQTHAGSLVDQAKMLESVYTDTRDTAALALRAANAYEGIVMAINDAYNASRTATGVATHALGKSFGVGDVSANHRNRSAELLEAAEKKLRETDMDLQERLEDATFNTDKVEDTNQEAKDRLDNVNIQLPPLESNTVGTRARDAITLANAASQMTADAGNKVKNIIRNLPSNKAKVEKLFNDNTKTKKNTQYAEQQTQDVKEKVPQIMDLIELVGTQSKNVRSLRDSVMGNITELREKIILARDEANRIRVGMEFLGNTTVALRNPPDIDLAGSYSRLTTYIRTQQSDALLAYIGAEFIPDRPDPDFLALELRDGRVMFKYDLGTGAAEISHPWSVNDNQWYKVVAERIGKTGTLTLERDVGVGVESDKASGNSSGIFTVLELNPVTTKFYLGGVPSTTMLPRTVIGSNYYEGAMEGVAFDSQPMGIWNFVYGDNNYIGAIERNVLVEEKSNGFSFNGNGYAIVSAREVNFRPQQKATIIMHFKTYASNGLLFFMGKGRDFSSIELRDGRISFQYDLGGMPAKLMTVQTYNDGAWHKIQAARDKQTGFLRVDEEAGIEGRSPGTLASLSYTDDIFIGGFNELIMPVKYVSAEGFRGCIKDVQFDSTVWDLINNNEAKGVVRGCPEQMLRTATFGGDIPGHIAIPMDSIGVNFDVTFRMKTVSNSSLLMYTSDNNQNTVFSVSTSMGKIIVTADPGGDLTRLESKVKTYNDGNWHYISIMKMGRKLMMNIDDKEIIENPTQSLEEEIITQRPIFFGGTDFSVPESSVGATAPFFGCISDITINGKFKNFASIQSQNIRAVTLGDCSESQPSGPVVLPPVVTPKTGPPEPTTPTAVRQCALSTDVDISPQQGAVSGKLFGTFTESREEYALVPASMTVRFTLLIEFKTTSTTGVLFYASDSRHRDFVGVYMLNGKIGAAFNCGTGTGRILSFRAYNDGQWHTMKFARNLKRGELEIDGEKNGVATSSGFTRSLNEKPPYYLGGLPMEVAKKASKNLEGASTSFQGCVRNLMVNDRNFSNPQLEFQVQPCSTNLEQGSYFYSNGGYVQLTQEKFVVGLDLEFSVEIRPRNLTGVILSVHSTGSDFMALQMKDGEIIFSADNGGGIITTKYTPPTNNLLCNGEWHTISAVKAKSTLLMTVDGQMIRPVSGKAGSSSADTTEPLFVGGVPDLGRRGLVADGSYLGCIRNLAIGVDRTPQYITAGTVTGSVKADSCPAN
ncbi:laminin subunit alpha-like isoform X1 [Mizuhopecten yessoensis]|uniref:laminin subunit alpha-like isoform X1 n=1 Tax=Mizuhopecten yessoensis TaxID=6573 RepID=UPI000B45E925|nr:laminin subunit alpha-like isoform X1 [Mizuhopecten yessoensis]